MSGFTYVLMQNVVLLGVVAILGVLVGVLVTRARTGAARPDGTPDTDGAPAAPTETGTPATAESAVRMKAAPAATGPDSEADRSAARDDRPARSGHVEADSPGSESRENAGTSDGPDGPDDLHGPANPDDRSADASQQAGPDAPEPLDPPSTRGTAGDDTVARLQEQLEAARTYVEWLSAQMEEVEGHAAVEYGRLEAAALRALDETISADQVRIKRLEEELEKAHAEQLDHRQHLLVSEQRFESLRAALADRDARIAELDNELKQLRRPWVAQKIKEGPR